MAQIIVEYSITEAALAEMKSMYMGLKVLSLDDEKGFKAVHSARMIVKGKRIEVEKRRKELKADALEYGKKVDSEAKKIFALLEPIEDHLTNEEEKVTKEKDRIRAEQEANEKAKIERRVNALFQYGIILSFADVQAMTDEEFQKKLALTASIYETEQTRIAEERHRIEEEQFALKKVQEEENIRLEKIRQEQAIEREKIETIRKEQEEANRKIETEKKALEDARQAEEKRIEREAFEKQAFENARIQAEKETREKIDREAREKKEREEHEAAEQERQESLKPDKEKLIVWAGWLVPKSLPQVSNSKAQDIVINANKALHKLSEQIIKQAREL